MGWDATRRGGSDSSRDVFTLFGLHLDEEFRGFLTYGIKMVNDYNMATPDFNIRNCLFRNNGTALYINGWNNYVYCIDGNLFLDNNIGVGTSGSGNFNLYNCHFERSATCDILMPDARFRGTALHLGGFRRIYRLCRDVRYSRAVDDRRLPGFRLEECVTRRDLGGLRRPGHYLRLRVHQPAQRRPAGESGELCLYYPARRLLTKPQCGNKRVFRRGANSSITEITGRKQKPALTSARQSFFQETDTYLAPTGKVFDARVDFGASGTAMPTIPRRFSDASMPRRTPGVALWRISPPAPIRSRKPW